MFHMRDEAGGDDKILCIPAGDPRKSHIKELEDINEFDRLEIQHFFETYKDLEPGKSVEGAHWTGRVEAEETVRQAVQRAKDAGLSTARWRTPEMGNKAIAEFQSKVRHSEAELQAAIQKAVRELATKDNPLSDD